MDNYQIADQFALLSKLMDIHGENSFKSRSYAIAAFTIEKLATPLQTMLPETFFSIKGIGESIGKKIVELLETGRLAALEEIIGKTPPGIIEMLSIKGIGPKKIAVIWKEMEIESIGELLYACKENRLKLFKGFGEKTQQNIRESIEFYLGNQGIFLYAQVEAIYPPIKQYLETLFGKDNVRITGAYRRQEATIEALEFVITETHTLIKEKMQSAYPPELLEETADSLLYKLANGLRLRFYSELEQRDKRLFFTTGSPAFLEAFTRHFPFIDYSHSGKDDTDSIFFTEAGIPYIAPYLRESAAIIEKAVASSIPVVIEPSDIRGIIHSHSNWSDGSSTLEELAKAAMTKGLEYLVISDHSKSAFYANGLSEERIREQQHAIDQLNQQLAPFKIFKSIECDILNDGSLDYNNEVLATFDLVIASIHSNLKMNEEKAMYRLIRAIEHPYTTILGHLTGRLLLSREGYPVNHRKIIDACAVNQVVIELNAHPSRLDIDWKHIEYALSKNVLISIDPDAHTIEGLDDTRYGVLVAQKAMVTKMQNLSSFSLQAFESFLQQRKANR